MASGLPTRRSSAGSTETHRFPLGNRLRQGRESDSRLSPHLLPAVLSPVDPPPVAPKFRAFFRGLMSRGPKMGKFHGLWTRPSSDCPDAPGAESAPQESPFRA